MTPPGRPARGAAQIPLAVTMGEPAGIGAEITLMAWRVARDRADVTPGPFIAIDDPERLQALSDRLGLDVPVAAIARPGDAAAAFDRALPVIPISLKAQVRAGAPDPANAPAVLESIERAVALAQHGEAAAVVTNPIQKKVLYGAGFRHPGHTEFLADLAGTTKPPVMMLVCPGLRVVPVTIHVPLVKALAMLSTDMIVHAGRVTAAALKRDFGVAAPSLAVAGINPHAGEQGTIGREEIDIIAPAVDALRGEGIAVSGPDPADTMFHAEARTRYDAALCMYHDQALIPLKTIDFIHGVNVTLGLPFVRTSPDHGTALGIAGTGTASPASLIAALETARQMAEARARHDRQPVA